MEIHAFLDIYSSRLWKWLTERINQSVKPSFLGYLCIGGIVGKPKQYLQHPEVIMYLVSFMIAKLKLTSLEKVPFKHSIKC